MFGMRGAFPYLECSDCGTIQIQSIPEDMGLYYPDDYYSMNAAGSGWLKKFLKRRRVQHALSGKGMLGGLLVKKYGRPDFVEWVQRAGIGSDDAVLDVGCGEGQLLVEMQNAGFRRLTGVDPFVSHDIVHPGGVQILRRELSQVEGQFDLVMLHHCLEHVPDPLATLQQVNRLLKPGRQGLVRLPLADSYVWRHYGINWVQLDAPRHFHIPTVSSMKLLAEKAGFDVVDVVFDSTEFQFWGSELYARDIPLHDARAREQGRALFSPVEIATFRKHAAELNETGQGDSAAFYLRKK